MLRTEIPFRGLDGRVAEQKLDLLDRRRSSAEFGASPPKVMGAEALDPDQLGRLLDDGPDGPVAQTFPAELSVLPDRSKQPPLVDAGRVLPDLDSLLHPDRNGHRPESPETLGASGG